MIEISGLQREIGTVQAAVLAIGCVIAALRRVPEGTTKEQLEMEILFDAVQVRAGRNLTDETRDAFDREISRLLDLLCPVEA